MVRFSGDGADQAPSGFVDKKIKGHWLVESVEMASDESTVTFALKCLAADERDQVGRTISKNRVWLVSNDPSKQGQTVYTIFDWAEALALTEKLTGKVFDAALRKQVVEQKLQVEFDFYEAESRTFCGDTKSRKGREGDMLFWSIGYTILNPFDERAKDWPKDQSLLGMPAAAGAIATPGDTPYDAF